MEGIGGMKGWRWILIIEGIPTVLLGLVTYWSLADNPETASYLSEEERRFMVIRRSRDVSQTASAQELHWKDVRSCFTDWKSWAL